MAALRDQFEKKPSTDEVEKRASWKQKQHQLPLPGGEEAGVGVFKAHEQYKKQTSFSKPPPPRRSLEELLRAEEGQKP